MQNNQPKTDEDHSRYRQLPGGDYWYMIADRRCPCCGYMMAPLPELWGMYDTRICRICETPAEVTIKVVHDEH